MLVPVPLPAVESLVALGSGLDAREMECESRVGVPPRDGLTVVFTEASEPEPPGLDHSVTTAVVSVSTATNPSMRFTASIASFCAAFCVATRSMSGRPARSLPQARA